VDMLGLVEVNVLDAVAFQAGGPWGFRPTPAFQMAPCPGQGPTPLSPLAPLLASAAPSMVDDVTSRFGPSSTRGWLPESSEMPDEPSTFEPASLGPPFVDDPPSRGIGSFTNGSQADTAQTTKHVTATVR